MVDPITDVDAFYAERNLWNDKEFQAEIRRATDGGSDLTLRRYLDMVPEAYFDAAFETWDDFDEATRGQLQDVQDWLVRGEPQGLYLYGPPGCGKTFLATAAGRQVAASGKIARWYSVPQLCADVRASAGPGRLDFTMPTLCHPMQILDDLGVEKGTEAMLERLYLMFDRWVSAFPNSRCIITTNLDPPALAAHHHERLSSRLAGACEVVECWGQDYRLIKAGMRIRP